MMEGQDAAPCTALARAVVVVSALIVAAGLDRAGAADLDVAMAAPDLEVVSIDSDPKESFLAIALDTVGRIFVGGREAIFVYESDGRGGYRPREELVRFPPHTWVYDLAVRGRDLYALTISALYVIRDGAAVRERVVRRDDVLVRERVTGREKLEPERIVWGGPLGHVHQCLHGMAWGPEGDIYFAMGDPHPGEYMDFNRRDHWWHWTFFSRAGEKLAYSGVGGVLRCRPDGSRLQVVAEGTRNSCGLAFDRQWNLFTNDNDHEGIPQDFVPGRLLHVTRRAYFSWPRGWMVRKEPDRADLLETMVPDLGRFVPVGQTYYDEEYLGDDYRGSLLVARWGTRSMPRYPLLERGASFSSREVPFLIGREQARPVHVAVGRGGRVFASIAHMEHNEGSPIYRSDLVMIRRRDERGTRPFEPYIAVEASAERLWRELSDGSWWRRYRAHVEILRRGGDLLDEAAARLDRLSAALGRDADPSLHHLIWLAAASQRPRAEPLLLRLITSGDAHVRRQALRALGELAPRSAHREVVLAALRDESAGVRQAALEALLARPGELDARQIIPLAADPDSYLRQAALRLLAEQAELEAIVDLARSDTAAERVVAIIAAGFRLTLAPSTRPLPSDVPLHQLQDPMRVVRYADRTEDLREAARVGVFNIGDWWKRVRDEPESRALFDVLRRALDDDDEMVRLHAARFLYVINDERSDERARELLAAKRALAGGPVESRPGEEEIPERVRQSLSGGAEKTEAEQAPFDFAGVDWTEELRRGDPERGRKRFEEIGCSKCHAAGTSQAPGLGPSLAEAGKRMTPAYVAESILLPSSAINPSFRASLIVTTGGETLVGLVTSENADSIELQLLDTTRRSIPAKTGVTFRQSLDRSPMPAGLVRSRDELRDLLAFVLAAPVDDAGLLNAVTFYASFDESIDGTYGKGELSPRTRFDHPTKKGEHVFERGVDETTFRIARNLGVHRGALYAAGVLPRRGRIFFPAEGNIAFNSRGWGGSVSFWINTDPDRLLRTPFCDPVQITHRGSGDGGLWIDFPNVKPRDLRLGAFSAVLTGEKKIDESDPAAPIIRVKSIGFREGEWHHIAMTWSRFDSGSPDARAALYIDGRLVGELEDRDIAMRWQIERAGIYVAVNLIGLIDELAVFDRPLDPAEVERLRREPGLLARLAVR